MSNSLRDQLMQLGFKAPPKPERKPKGGPNKSPAARGGQAKSAKPTTKGKSREEMDLARAYAIRAQKEKEERIEAERQKQEQARLRREAREKLERLLEGRTLNQEQAEIARHFEYGGKIRRIYVNAEQLAALNAGELGVIQNRGRYLLVDAVTLAEAEALFAEAIALKVDPDAPAEADPYADPKYQVPDDLVW